MVATAVEETGTKGLRSTGTTSYETAKVYTSSTEDANTEHGEDAGSTTKGSAKMNESHLKSLVTELENPCNSSSLPVEDTCATSTTTVDCANATC